MSSVVPPGRATTDRRRAPAVAPIATFLNLCADQPNLLTIWAMTPVGLPLSGTQFIVAKRHVALGQS